MNKAGVSESRGEYHSHKAPDEWFTSHRDGLTREGISLLEVADMFPTEEVAAKWFEKWT